MLGFGLRFRLDESTPRATRIYSAVANMEIHQVVPLAKTPVEKLADFSPLAPMKPINLETAVGRRREAQEAEVQADCGIPSSTSSVLRVDDASRINPASCAYRPEPTAVSRIKGIRLGSHLDF